MSSRVVDRAGRPPLEIAVKAYVTLDGARQGMFVRSADRRNPVLLYLHGGMPDFFLDESYPSGLEDVFTTVWWEQRGQGLSFDPRLPPESIAPDQLVADTIALSERLCRRFGQDRIHLMGHSGGTFLGIQAAARAPHLYHAYIGVAQMTYQLESEREAYADMLGRARAEGERRLVRRLEKVPLPLDVPLPRAYTRLRDVAMHRLGVGTTHEMRSVVTGLLVPSLLSRRYTARERVDLWRGKRFSGRHLWEAELATDLRVTTPRVDVPVYLLHGIHDRTVSYRLARAYLGQLDAPVKGFYTFAHSAHSPLFEEPERVRRILREDVLPGRTLLADPPC